MDSLFSPRTFSTDWEVMVIDRLGRRLDTCECDAFAGVLQAEFGLPIHIDWDTIEFGLGVNHSYTQFRDRIVRLTDRAGELVRDLDMDLFPAAAEPRDEIYCASHIHVGSLFDECAGQRLANRLMPYIPALGALAANAPFSEGRIGEFKSYRIRHMAHGCTRPHSVQAPAVSQATWGSDAAPKLYGRPTLEVRIIDCATSRQFLAELGTFVAAFVHQQGAATGTDEPDPARYRECMINRWLAAKYGLQATFLRDGKPIPVVELLDEMLDMCDQGLAGLGVKRSELELIETMISKRVGQADFALSVAQRYPDPHLLVSAYAKLIRHWDVFDEYLAAAEALEPVPAPDEEAILHEHLKAIGEGTHFYRTRDVMFLPAPVSDAVLETMISRGWVTKEITVDRGPLLHRVR